MSVEKMKQPLLVIIGDRLSDLVKKGSLTERYYNPGNLFSDVHILMTNNDRPDPAAVQHAVGDAHLHLHNLPSPSFRQSWGYFPLRLQHWCERGVALARSIQPALIRNHGFHVHTYLTGYIKKALDVPAVVSLHGNPDVDYGRLEPTLQGQLVFHRWKAIAERYLHDIDHFILVYTLIQPYLDSRGITNYSIIYNVIGHGAVPKTSYQAQGKLIRGVCAGRQQSEQKDQRAILRAAAQVPNVSLSFFGNGDLHAELIRLSHELGMQDRVFFNTGIPNCDMVSCLNSFDFYAYNSINYEISRTVMEAALVGLPILHNLRSPCLSQELSADYVYKVENSVEGYRQGLAAFANDQALRERYGRAARDFACQHWAPETTENQVVQLYLSLIQRSSSTRSSGIPR